MFGDDIFYLTFSWPMRDFTPLTKTQLKIKFIVLQLWSEGVSLFPYALDFWIQ